MLCVAPKNDNVINMIIMLVLIYSSHALYIPCHLFLIQNLPPKFWYWVGWMWKKYSTYHSLNFSNIGTITNHFLCTKELNLAQYLETQVVSDLEVPAQLQEEQLWWHIDCDVAWNTVSHVTVMIIINFRTDYQSQWPIIRTHLWFFSELDWLNWRPQSVQWYGRWPEWMRSWRIMWERW